MPSQDASHPSKINSMTGIISYDSKKVQRSLFCCCFTTKRTLKKNWRWSEYESPADIMPFQQWFEEKFPNTAADWYRPCFNRVTDGLMMKAHFRKDSFAN